MAWKKAQNPKDEVSSSKIDEMAKETSLYSFVITNGEKSRSANAPNSLEFEE